MPTPPLPDTAQAVAEVIGRHATLLLADEVRFRSLYVPHRINVRHWIARAIGLGLAERLVEEFAGMQLPLAKCKAVRMAERDERIVAAHRKGITVNAIADLLKVSRFTVYRAIERHEAQEQAQARAQIQQSPTTPACPTPRVGSSRKK